MKNTSTPIIQTLEYKTSSKKLQLHFHEDYEILFITEGIVEIVINNKSFRAQKGDIVFLNCFELHYTNIIKTPYERYVITLSRTTLEKTFFYDTELLSLFKKSSEVFDRCFHFENHIIIKSQLDRIIEEYKSPANDKYSEELCAMYIKEFLIYAYRNLQKLFPFEESKLSIPKFVIDVQHYFDEHYSKNIKITDICKKAQVSPQYFSHCFKTFIGISPKQYLMQLRLNNAANSLVVTNAKIIDIAYSVGFSDINNFTRKFKDQFKKSPSEFRNEYSKNK